MLAVSKDASPEDIKEAFCAGVDVGVEPSNPLTDFNLSLKVRY